jgi:hypothetical protein
MTKEEMYSKFMNIKMANFLYMKNGFFAAFSRSILLFWPSGAKNFVSSRMLSQQDSSRG